MKKFLFMGLALATLTLNSACSDNKAPVETTTATPAETGAAAVVMPDTAAAAPADGAAAIYTCPMHPEVASAAPGQCPQCHMDLVVKQ